MDLVLLDLGSVSKILGALSCYTLKNSQNDELWTNLITLRNLQVCAHPLP